MPSACTGLLWQAVARTSDDNGPRIFFVSVSAYQEWWTSCWYRMAPWIAYASGIFYLRGVRRKLCWRTAVPPTTDFDSSNGAAVFVIHKKGGKLVGLRRGRSLPMSTSSKVTASCVTFDSAPMLP